MLFAQISDLHIRMPGQKAYRVVETDRYLPPAVQAVNALDPAPDLVVVSGDLTDFGRPAEYAHLRRHARRAAHALTTSCRATTTRARGWWRPSPITPTCAHGRRARAGLRAIHGGGPPAAPGHAGHGGAHEEPRRAVRAAPRLAGRPAGRTAGPAHRAGHAPSAVRHGIGHMDAIGLLRGAPELEALVSRHQNVERILCGHPHPHHLPPLRRHGGLDLAPVPRTRWRWTCARAGPSAFAMEPPGFHLHQWRDGGLITHTRLHRRVSRPLSLPRRRRLAGKVIGPSFACAQIDVIERLIGVYLERRDSDAERFVDVVWRGIEPFKERVYGISHQEQDRRGRSWLRLELGADGAMPRTPAASDIIVPLAAWQEAGTAS